MNQENMQDPVETARQHFAQNCNCAQAVFSALAPQMGLDEGTAIKIGTAFGGGLARRGETCGAVSGALMVLGLAHGAGNPEAKEKVYRLAKEFMRRFEARHGSLLCRDLLGCDISTPEGLEKAHASGVTKAVCPGLVKEATGMVLAVLEGEEKVRRDASD